MLCELHLIENLTTKLIFGNYMFTLQELHKDVLGTT